MFSPPRLPKNTSSGALGVRPPHGEAPIPVPQIRPRPPFGLPSGNASFTSCRHIQTHTDTYRYIRRRLKPSHRGGIIGFHLCGYGVLSLFGTAGRGDTQINSCIYGNRRRSELSLFRGCVRLRLLRSRPFCRKPLYCVKHLFAVRNPSLNRTLCGRSERLQPTSFSGGLRRI